LRIGGMTMINGTAASIENEEAIRRARAQAEEVFPKSDAAGPYQATPSGLVRIEIKGPPNKQVEIPHSLTNFRAQIKADIRRDDGAETARAFEIEARLGERSATFTVSATQFAGMRWPTEHLGAQAVVYAGHGTADHARAAIQLLSRNPVSRTVFMHTGWRKIGDAWVYLHGAGGIGEVGMVAGIEVDLPPELAAFNLDLPADPIPALRASLGLLDLGPDRVTVPTYGAIWRALLGRTDFSIFLYGPTGVFKTELAALIQQHLGAGFDARHLPTSFTSTANTNESLAFAAKDAVLVVDELHPPASGSDRESMHRDAARLLRAQGNAAGRGRMRSDGTLRPPKPPRGLMVATGEELPRGQSVHARLFTLEIQAGAIDAEKLTACQADAAAGLYAQATAAFIRWLAPRLDDAQVEFETLRREARAEVRHEHARTADIRAQLTVTYSIFLRALLETGVVTNAEVDHLKTRIGAALEEVAVAQTQYAQGAEPTGTFIRLLSSALGSGSAHVADGGGAAPEGREQACGWRLVHIGAGANERTDWQPLGARIGWIDGDNLYLDRDAAYRAAQSMAVDGCGIEVSATTLMRRLRDKGMLLTTDHNRETLTVRLTLEGRRRDVLHLHTRNIGSYSLPKPDQSDQPDQFDDEEEGPGRVASRENGHFEGPDQRKANEINHL